MSGLANSPPDHVIQRGDSSLGRFDLWVIVPQLCFHFSQLRSHAGELTLNAFFDGRICGLVDDLQDLFHIPELRFGGICEQEMIAVAVDYEARPFFVIERP